MRYTAGLEGGSSKPYVSKVYEVYGRPGGRELQALGVQGVYEVYEVYGWIGARELWALGVQGVRGARPV